MSSLIGTDRLAGMLGEADLVILDASMHLPTTGRDARTEFLAGHIPGARFLDLASLSDTTSPVPAALPTAPQFAARMADLGIAPGMPVVLYDDSALKTSARAWWMARMNAIAEVAVLDGGLAKWTAEGRPIESGSAAVPAADHPAPSADWTRVRSKGQMLANIGSRAEQTLDARDAGRFTGSVEDTVHNLPGGHIPGARNLPFTALFREDGTYRHPADLRAVLQCAGVDLDRPVVASCGSGITASVLLFALHLIGKDDTALYDGSWSEWAADPAMPKETGEAAGFVR